MIPSDPLDYPTAVLWLVCSCVMSPVRAEDPTTGSVTRFKADQQRMTFMQPYAPSRLLGTRGGGQYV
jgi:hypothetical protein